MGREEVIKETLAPPEQAFLVGVDWKQGLEGRYIEAAWNAEESLAELERLAETAGLEVVGQSIQRLERPNPATFVGKGKAQEIADMVRALGAGVVIFDDELSPRHQRELEGLFSDKVKVMDRTGLILDIFAQHANTREGALQVELAQYEYRLPRLTQAWTDRAFSQQTGGRAGGSTGGVGLRGPGETRLEMDRRVIRQRIAQIKRELEEVRAHRARHRVQRRRSGLPTVALVGYTNAGKSTLLNALSGASVYVADELFATLDPTTRRVELPGGTAILVTDTVGFIQKLPTQLVAAFRATLEEVTDADLLLHVIDASHSQAREQARAVYDALQEIGASDVPILTALNKVDQFDDPLNAGLALHDLPDTVAISALTGYGMESLKARLEEALEAEMSRIMVLLPFERGDLVSIFHERGLIQTEEYQEQGTVILGRLPHALLSQFEAYQLKGRRGK